MKDAFGFAAPAPLFVREEGMSDDVVRRYNGARPIQAPAQLLADAVREVEVLREENARLRSILAAKVRPPFDDDLAGEPYAAEDRQPEPGGLGRIGQVEGGGEDGGA